jgi:hypothetical protein
MTNDGLVLDRVCGNCHRSHPAEPVASQFCICLQDPEFEPYLDDIIERQDFSRCQELTRRTRFPWNREACKEFDPVDDLDEAEPSPELGARILRLAQEWQVDQEDSLELAIREDAASRRRCGRGSLAPPGDR